MGMQLNIEPLEFLWILGFLIGRHHFFASVDITFDGAFIVAGYPAGSNNGDFLTLSTLSISE